jgi:hypothetical protein
MNTHWYYPKRYQVSDQPPKGPNRKVGHQDEMERLLSCETDIDTVLCDDHWEEISKAVN